MSKTDTQNRLIYRELSKGRILSPLDVQKICGSMKASTRIGEIARKERVTIKSAWVTRRDSRHKVYFIPDACLPRSARP